MPTKRDPTREAFPDEPSGEAVVRALLAEIEEDERLSALIGVDLNPPDPRPEHAPKVYGDLQSWLRRSEEVHRFLEQQRARQR
jgi:hypothetical protein